MDNSVNNISDFEILLRKQSFKKPSFLYNKDLNVDKQTYKPQDVIKTVCSQVKAYQLADCVERSGKSGYKDSNEAKKSNFLPLYKPPVYGSRMQEVPTVNANKFETQCVLDTQLMNIIDGDSTDANTGMTQEFDTTFFSTDDKKSLNQNLVKEQINDGVKNKIISVSDVESKYDTKSDQSIKEIDMKVNQNETEIQSEIYHNAQSVDISIDINAELNSQVTKTATEDTVTFIDNFPVTQEVDEEVEGLINNSKEIDMDKATCSMEIDLETVLLDTERIPSPVLKTNPIKIKLKTPPPLVVSLETFENFENVVMSLIEETDFETAKHLINSQILGKELCLDGDAELLLGNERDKSPVLDFNSDELQINLNELMPDKIITTNEIVLSPNYEHVTEKHSEVLKDEILFSSDEEDFVNIVSQNLPPTCALETTNDQTDILDKSMFVGFLTASNKSIQISRDSYEHAQIILSDDDGKAFEEFTLTDLVEKCGRLNKHEDVTSTTLKSINNCKSKALELVLVSNGIQDKPRKENEHKDSIECNENIETCNFNINKNTDIVAQKPQSFNRFMTASNKKITMSDRALERCKKVFEDIDLTESCQTVKVSEKKDYTVDIKPCLNKPDNNVGNTVNVEDNINDKINDKLLLEEFENIEMSLEKKETNTEDKKHDEFEGFRKENNKKITISNEAMLKTNNLFQDIDKELNEQIKYAENEVDVSKEVRSIKYSNQPLTSKAEFVGFKTANNKEIKISDEALIKSKYVFKDIGKDKHKIKTIEDLISQPLKSNPIFVGFKTANNKDIKISDAAFCKTKNIFKDIDTETANLDTPMDANQLSASKTAIYKTETSKGIKNSDPAMSNSKNIGEKCFIQDVIEEADPTFERFKTGRENHLKCRNLFSDILGDNYGTKMIQEKSGDLIKNTKTGFVGFITASNKVVNVSTEALEKSKKVFSDLDTIDPNDKTQLCPDKNKDENYVFKGFQTASKKPVTVSEDALARSKIIVKGSDEANDTLPEKLSKNTNVEFLGFQTANKKPVDISIDALIASKKLRDDLGHQGGNSKSVFVGFKTASNKNVNISDEALAKCKNIFSNIEDIPIAQQPVKLDPKENIFIGFQTGTKKKIEISKEALKKANHLFNEEFDKQDTEKPFAGFQTANYNKIKVSEQALAKSRQLFQDIDTKSVINVAKKDNEVPHNISTEICITKDSLGVNTDTNKVITISEDALTNTKKLLGEHIEKDKKQITVNRKTDFPKEWEIKKDFLTIDKILDTQVINDFDEDTCSEDFRVTRPNKRSGSPILMCPKAKKIKKFETPYKTQSNQNTVSDLQNLEVTKPANIVTFIEDYKKNKKYTLKDLTVLEKDKSRNIDPYLLNFNLENILNFEFDDGRNDFKEGKNTIDDIKEIFIEGTDKKLIPDGWLDIHLKLILWKLISYEINFPNTLGKVCTVKNVIDQLKYRYDKELYNAERPVLRKILEKDDVPYKTMVLCVAAIYVDGVSVVSAANLNNIELLLTDGWYFIKATIDNMLSKLVYDGKIVVGSKIVTCGAELVNCEQGVAPWEDTSSVRLSLSGNSTRPARWHEKLGLRPCTLAARLAAVRVGGGKVARLRVRVVRVYPRLYVEKFQDGSTVTRSERLEHQYQMKHEAEREAMIEKIYEEVEKEMSDQESQDSDCTSYARSKRKCYDSGSQIAKMMKISKDPMEFRAQLTSSQIHLLQDHVSKQRDKYLQAIQDRVQERLHTRNVVTLARGRVVGLEKDGDRVTVTKGMLSIWKPNEEVLDIFKEGSWIEVTNVFPTAFRNSEIQLSAGRQSLFRPVKCNEDDFKPYLISLSRTCFNVIDLTQNPSMSMDCNEIDTVGVVFSIDPSNRDFDPNKNQFQNVYLADIDKNMIGINFWGGIKKFGYENILDTGQVIYCGNLQKRAGNSRKNIPQFRATEFAIFTKTPRNEKGREMVDEINKKMFSLDRRKFCEDCMAVKQNYSVIRCLNDSENVSPYRFNNSDYNLGRNKVFIDTPVGVKVKNKAEDFNLTGLDFESTFKQQDTQLSPKTIERKKKVNEKIAKLKMYGEPPPLCPLNIINKSRDATNSYKSPLLRSEETSNNASAASANRLQSVATPTKLPDDGAIDGGHLVSPIISNKLLNRTYVKRSINPVKLSFSENFIEDNVDKTVEEHFAEEFDSSPPLSLE